ncbi:MAG: hypothetical protein JWL96_2931 [Sphingomonas bacterium]|nr:hypothetical protein [Sphingomonas bacterium]
MVLNHRDCPEPFAGEERRAARAGSPCKRRDDVRRAAQGNREAAGAFWRVAASLVGHGEATPLPPRSSPHAKIRSVTAVQHHVITL